MITDVSITNYKSIQNTTVKLGKFNVLIGPNNSGKSNFCSIFKLIHDLSLKGGKEVFNDRFNTDQLVGIIDSKAWLNFLISTTNRNLNYQLVLEYLNSKASPFYNETITEKENEKFFLSRAGTQLQFPRNTTFLPDNSILNQPFPGLDWHPAIDLVNEIRSFSYFRFIPSSIHKAAYIKEGSPVQIDESGFGLPAVLTNLLHRELKTYIGIVEKMREKFKDIEDIIPEETTITDKVHNEATKQFENIHYQGYRLAFKIKGRWGSLESPHISDGISYFLLFLTIMHLPKKPKLIIVEEPENGIHPSNLKEIISYIKQLSEENDCQVIITTHSPYLLDFVKTEDVLIFYRKEDGLTQVRKMEEVPNIKEKLKYFMLGELWTEKGEKSLIEEIENAKN